MEETEEGSLLPADSGLERHDEIRQRLAEVMKAQGGERIALLRQAWSLLVVLGFAVAAVLFDVVRRRWGQSGRGAPPPGFGDRRWVRLLLPGLDSLQEGRGVVAFLALLFTVILVVVPLGDDLGFSTSLDYAGGRGAAVLSAAALVLFFAARGWWIWRGEG